MRFVSARVVSSVLILFSGMPAFGAEPDPCKAASTKVAYEPALPVPSALRKKIEVYRTKWRALCDRQSKKSRPSLADLYALAAGISVEFEKNVLIPTGAKGSGDGKADKISDLVSEKYPAFIPAFEGSFIEYEYFRPVQSAFTAKADLGTEEDRAFWTGYGNLRGPNLLPPWFEQTWDYGGCLRFGEFDWVKEIEALEKLKKVVKSVSYAELITEIEGTLTDPFERAAKASALCTCKGKDVVLPDLKKLAAYFGGTGAASTLTPKMKPMLEALIGGIDSKKVTVHSQAEANCSGG